MKKLIAIILITVLLFSGCEYLPSPNAPEENIPTDNTPSDDTPGDEPGDEPGNEPGDEPGDEPECKHFLTITQNVKSATCTEAGYTGDKVCSACGITLQAGKAVPKTSHGYLNGVCSICGAKENGSGSSDQECDTHKDENDDGVCDICSVSVLVWYEFYSVNDLHGKFKDTDSQPGVDELTTYLKEAKSKGNVIILSAGDMWQGSSESNLTKGMIITEWMNHLGFVSMTIGNHEFDWTSEYISQNLAMADFPFLAINIYDKNTDKPVDFCQPSTMIEMGGLQIGIIGAIGDCYTSISGESIGDVYFKVGNELTNLVMAESTKLRNMGADLIVYSIHSGGDYDEKLSNGYVDLVFEGHTHQSYVSYDTYGVAHIQGGGENKGISYAKLSVNSANGNVKLSSAKVIKSSVYSSYEPDAIVEELLEKYDDMISKAYEVLGYNAKYRDDSDIEKLVAQLYYEYGVAKWGEEYNIVLGGGSINTRSPYNIYEGDVQYSHLQSILPFDNEITLCSIKGSDLLKKFINSSSYAAYYKIDPDSIDPNGIYYIVTDTWSSGWEPNNLTEIARLAPGIYARDLLAEYVKQGNWEK